MTLKLINVFVLHVRTRHREPYSKRRGKGREYESKISVTEAMTTQCTMGSPEPTH